MDDLKQQNPQRGNRTGTWLLIAAAVVIIGGFALYAHEGNKGMERAANSAGTTTQRFDANAAANQGSTPPGDARAVGGDRTK